MGRGRRSRDEKRRTKVKYPAAMASWPARTRCLLRGADAGIAGGVWAKGSRRRPWWERPAGGEHRHRGRDRRKKAMDEREKEI